MKYSFILFLVMCFSSLLSQSTSGLNKAYLPSYDQVFENSLNHRIVGDSLKGESPQISTYIPIIKKDAEWFGIKYYGFGPGNDMVRFAVDTLKTLKNGKLYSKVLFTDKQTGPISTQYHTYIREDDGKLFVLDTIHYSEEILALDMALSIGAEFDEVFDHSSPSNSYKLKVISNDTVTYLDNVPRKRISLDCDNDGFEDEIWIEGIGRARGMFHTESVCLIDRGDFTLRCYLENGVQVYSEMDNKPCWYISGVEDNHSLKVRISPNPSHGMIYIDNLISPVTVLIYNMAGIEILRFEHVLNQIDIGGLNQGLYILEVRQGKNIERQRIVKID